MHFSYENALINILNYFNGCYFDYVFVFKLSTLK